MRTISPAYRKAVCYLLLILLASAVGAWKMYQHWMLRELSQREAVLDPIVQNAAKRHGVSPALVKAVIWKESRGIVTTVGSSGEIGLMQIMPGAVEDWSRGTKNPIPARRDRFKPEMNIEIGTWYLAQAGRHWQEYKSKEILQLAEYNAGYRRVNDLWKPADPSAELPLEKISFPSTRDYIKQVLQRKKHYETEAYRYSSISVQPPQQ